MSEKREVLKVLDGDLHDLRNKIRGKHKSPIDLATRMENAAEKEAISKVRKAIASLGKEMGFLIGENLRINLDTEYADISIDSKRQKVFCRCTQSLKCAEAAMAKEIEAADERAASIRRRITLYGVDAEVLRMLDELAG